MFKKEEYLEVICFQSNWTAFHHRITTLSYNHNVTFFLLLPTEVEFSKKLKRCLVEDDKKMVYVQQGVMPLAKGACRGLRTSKKAKKSQNGTGGLSLDKKKTAWDCECDTHLHLGLRVRHTCIYCPLGIASATHPALRAPLSERGWLRSRFFFSQIVASN